MFPLLLTEAQARAAVNLPPATGTPDQYTERVTQRIAAVTELSDELLESTAEDGSDLWADTAALPAHVVVYAEAVFRETWSKDVGAHSPSFGTDRFGTDPPVGPAWVVSYYAEAWAPELKRRGFA